jgi:hypothetical protein
VKTDWLSDRRKTCHGGVGTRLHRQLEDSENQVEGFVLKVEAKGAIVEHEV